MQHLGRWLGPAAVLLSGLTVALLASILLVSDPDPLQVLQLLSADLLLVRDGGPRLGARPVRPDILLVRWDPLSATALGGGMESKLDDDLRLYQGLLQQGARVVADTRVTAKDAPGVQALLEGMAATDAGPRLLRDIQVPSADWFGQQQDRYLTHIGHDGWLIGAGYDPAQYLRFSPILGYSLEEGFQEELPVKVARAAAVRVASPPVDPARLALQTGIAADWSAQAGQPVPAGAAVSPSPYPLGPGLAFVWVSRPVADPALSLTVSPETFWIDYGPSGTGFPVVSYVDALDGHVGTREIADRIVIIDESGSDIFPIPSVAQRATTGLVAAYAVQSLLDGRTLQAPSLAATLVLIWIASLGGAQAVWRLRPLVVGLAMLGVLFGYVLTAVALYRAGLFPDLVLVPAALIAAAGWAGAMRYSREEQARRRIHDLFGRYVPRSVVAELVRLPRDQALALGGVRREVTVLFADVRGFTSFSEAHAPEEVLARLNRLLQGMVAAVFRHDGTVDKYIGDAIMVLFNAPLDQPDHAVRAVRAALEMQRSTADGLGGGLTVGIGIHTGEAVVGTVGTEERLEYTAIGSAVNLASRLCDLARGGEIIVSEEVYRIVADHVEADLCPPTRVKGIDRDLVTYRLHAMS